MQYNPISFVSGVGGALGIGVYVVITYVIKHQAGPSAVISVIIAGVAALLSGKYLLTLRFITVYIMICF